MAVHHISICLVLLHLVLLKGCVCQMQVNGKLQTRNRLVCGIRIGNRFGVGAAGSAFRLSVVSKCSYATQRQLGIKHWC